MRVRSRASPSFETRADHHLGVDLEAPLGEPGQLLQQQGGAGIDQQAAAQLGVGGVHRDVQRRKALFLDAAPVGRREIGEGEVRAVEKTQAVVVVLEVEAAAAPRRLLVDEAEGAAVVALAQAVEQGVAEPQPQALVQILLQLHHVEAAVGILHLEHQFLLPLQHLHIDQVPGTHAVDAAQPVTGLKAELLGDRAGLHRGDHGGLGLAGGRGQAGGGLLPHGDRDLWETGVQSGRCPDQGPGASPRNPSRISIPKRSR